MLDILLIAITLVLMIGAGAAWAVSVLWPNEQREGPE